MQAHGDDAIPDSAPSTFMLDIEDSQRARIISPMARSAKIVPAPGAAFARVCLVLAKAFSSWPVSPPECAARPL